VIEPRNYVVVGADAVSLAEGNTEARKWPSAEVPPGSKSRGTFIVGPSRNLGGPVVSVRKTGLGTPVNNPRPAGVAPVRLRERSKAQRRYREAKETKRRGRGDGKSECFTVLTKRGNRTRGTPWREGSTGRRERSRERWRRHGAP
jgi:hypothetical protein